MPDLKSDLKAVVADLDLPEDVKANFISRVETEGATQQLVAEIQGALEEYMENLEAEALAALEKSEKEIDDIVAGAQKDIAAQDAQDLEKFRTIKKQEDQQKLDEIRKAINAG